MARNAAGLSVSADGGRAADRARADRAAAEGRAPLPAAPTAGATTPGRAGEAAPRARRRVFIALGLLAAGGALGLAAAWRLGGGDWPDAARLSLGGQWRPLTERALPGLLAVLALVPLWRWLRGRRREGRADLASEGRYRQVVEASPVGVHFYQVDPDGRLVLSGTNPAADAALGTDGRRLIGRTLEEAFPALVGTEVPARFREVCREGRPWQCPALDYADDRARGTFDLHAFRAGPGSLVVMFTDVSERRRAEAALQASEERLRHLVESTRDWLWEVDASGVYTYCSPQCRDLLGYSPAELVGRTPFDVMVPREARRVRVLFSKLVLERQPVVALENVCLHRDGHEVVLETSGVPFFDPAGRLLGYRGIDRDVTDRRRAEEAVRALNADLEARVRARTAELEHAYRELEAFSYSVSHDLRAPLRSIDGFTRAVLEDYGGRLDEVGRGYLERVQGAAARMSALIEDLLALSRVTRQEVRREGVDLSAMAAEVAEELAAAAPGREVALSVQPGLEVQGDAKLLRQALRNLLENAWKFTGAQPAAQVSFGRSPDGVYFVRDNGTGFDMAYAHKLFAPFQRLHPAEDFPGTGIGLAIVQRVVHRHGGRVWAEAAPGAGATFHFTLPGS